MSIEDNESLTDEEAVESPLLVPDEEESTTTMSVPIRWSDQVVKLQSAATVLSHVLAVLSVALVSWWVHLLGGLSWKSGEAKKVFNYHPLLMVLLFSFMTVAALSFRSTLLGNRATRKLTHAISLGVATACGAVGLVAVFKSHNDAESGFIANMYSLHSWIGMLVVTFYLLQWFVGMYALWLGNPSWKATAHSVHKYVGPLIYQGVVLALLLGIQEKEGFVGCGYKVEGHADLWPLSHYFDIPLPCRVSHALGLCMFTMGASTVFALAELSRIANQEQHVL